MKKDIYRELSSLLASRLPSFALMPSPQRLGDSLEDQFHRYRLLHRNRKNGFRPNELRGETARSNQRGGSGGVEASGSNVRTTNYGITVFADDISHCRDHKVWYSCSRTTYESSYHTTQQYSPTGHQREFYANTLGVERTHIYHFLASAG